MSINENSKKRLIKRLVVYLNVFNCTIFSYLSGTSLIVTSAPSKRNFS